MRHLQFSLLHCLLLVLGAASWPLEAQDNPPSTGGSRRAKPSPAADAGDDLATIRQSARDFVDAFNGEDAKALAALWTEDGDYIDDSGRVFAGREAIEEEYSALFKEHDGIKLQVVIDSLRLLSADAAIEDGRAMLDPAPPGAPAIGRYTAVHVKIDGKWLMSTVRDVRIETPSAHRHVADLEWLIGTWTAEENGAKMVSVCRWVANKSFVERTYEVTHSDQSTTSGVQLIGFNPQGGHVQSWNFSSDGGHAVGLWTPLENGWQAQVRGMTGEGVSTAAVILLTKIDEDAYAWQSVQRSAGDAVLPDTGEVVLKRTTER